MSRASLQDSVNPKLLMVGIAEELPLVTYSSPVRPQQQFGANQTSIQTPFFSDI
jgi:hypothetical protein